MIRKVGANGKKPCYALEIDIERFFDTINHQILKTLFKKKITDEDILKIIDTIIDSFKVNSGSSRECGNSPRKCNLPIICIMFIFTSWMISLSYLMSKTI
jgi:hypothetical protein